MPNLNKRAFLLSIAAGAFYVMTTAALVVAQSRSDSCKLAAVIPLTGTEPPANIFIDPPLPGPLASRGVVIIQYCAQNLHIAPVFGPGSLAVSPRVGHVHVSLDDAPWVWADASGNPIILQHLPPGPHKVIIELNDANRHPLDRGSVTFVVLDKTGVTEHVEMNFKTADVLGLNIFYREAGDPANPTIVLLHGFPSSTYSFHDLIPHLADRFHVIAPDYPGMGYSEAPAPTVLRPTFDDMTTAIEAFIAQCTPGPVILYMHDIGGPIGMRIATAHPERIASLVFQNFTIAVEGWSPDRLKVYERLGGPETPENLAETEQFATVDRRLFLHKRGARRPEALNPDYWAMDAYALLDPGQSGLHVEVVYERHHQHRALPEVERLPEGPAAEIAHRVGAK